MRLSVSATTRQPRAGEINGVQYWFWNIADFEQAVREDQFLEWAQVHDNYYGTLASEVQPYREQGLGVLLDVDVQGWEQVKQRCPDAVSIFVRTSTMDMLEQRLRDRRTETEDALQRRLTNARLELTRAGEYDYQVVNDDLEKALASMRVILAELFA